jgi:hypothetical protein
MQIAQICRCPGRNCQALRQIDADSERLMGRTKRPCWRTQIILYDPAHLVPTGCCGVRERAVSANINTVRLWEPKQAAYNETKIIWAVSAD